MAGENHYSADKEIVTVFNEEGDTFEVSRPNARELVNTGNYFWKEEQIGQERIEEDGPADPAAAMQTVYDLDGNAHEVANANARDMVASGNYTWVQAHAETEEDSDDADADADADTDETGDTDASVDASTEEVVETNEPVENTPLDPVNDALHEIAARVTGDSDVAAYLGTFSEENLREMAMQRYGEKVHHRTSKENIIEKMVELEDAKLDAADTEDQA